MKKIQALWRLDEPKTGLSNVVYGTIADDISAYAVLLSQCGPLDSLMMMAVAGQNWDSHQYAMTMGVLERYSRSPSRDQYLAIKILAAVKG